MGYSVMEISVITGLKPHVLRYYESEGLLPHVKRTRGGIRQYTEKDLEWLSLIRCLKNTGMSIKQIRDFVSLSLRGPETLKKRCELLQCHREDVLSKIREMQEHLETVTHKIDYFTICCNEYQARRKP